MTSKKRLPKKNLSENSLACQKLYKEIDDLMDYFRWSSPLQLCEKIEPHIKDKDIIPLPCKTAYSLKRSSMLHVKLEKAFDRKNWETTNVTRRTLKLLEAVRNAIYMTDAYQESELYESKMPLDFRNDMRKVAKAIQRRVNKKYKIRARNAAD